MTNPESLPAAATTCDHHYVSRLLGGHPLIVRACTLCHTPDWNDLMEQAHALYQWGYQEGLAAHPPRKTLSAYDRPRKTSQFPCDGFPDRCPNLRAVEPGLPQHEGGIRCGCGDDNANDASRPGCCGKPPGAVCVHDFEPSRTASGPPS